MVPELQDKACDMYARIKGAMGPDAALEAGAEGIRNAVMPERSTIASLGAVGRMNPLNMPVREAGQWPDPRELIMPQRSTIATLGAVGTTNPLNIPVREAGQ